MLLLLSIALLRVLDHSQFVYYKKGIAAIECSRCPHCGYDLAGLPHQRCPECGLSLAAFLCAARRFVDWYRQVWQAW
jgi:ssDNA-binding Zn-finger/Zn-ribbon topoisomerase 1